MRINIFRIGSVGTKLVPTASVPWHIKTKNALRKKAMLSLTVACAVACANTMAEDKSPPESETGGAPVAAVSLPAVSVTADVSGDVKNLGSVSVTANTAPTFTLGSGFVSGMLPPPYSAPPLHLAGNKPTVTTTDSNKDSNGKNDKTKGPCDYAGDPVEVGSGAKIETATDFAVPGEMGLNFTRYYNSNYYNLDFPGSILGGWTTSFDYRFRSDLKQNPNCIGGGYPDYCPKVLIRPDGSTASFTPSIPLQTAPDGTHTFTEVGGGIATLTQFSDGSYVLHDEDSHILSFDNSWKISTVKDLAGIGWTYSRPDTNTTVITHTSGQAVRIVRSTTTVPLTLTALVQQPLITPGGGGQPPPPPPPSPSNQVTQTTVTDPAGNVYVYQSVLRTGTTNTSPSDYFFGQLQSVSLPGDSATVISFQYSTAFNYYNALTEVDYNGIPHDQTTYDSAGHAIQTQLADGSQKVSIAYSSNGTGPIATVTNELGHVAVHQFDGSQHLLSVTGQASSHCAATFNSRTYDDNGYPSTDTDNDGNVTQYTFASTGQLLQKVEAVGTPYARTTSLVWDSTPGTDRVLSVTVVGWLKTTFSYDANGRVTAIAKTNLSNTGTAQQTLTTTYAYSLYPNGMVATKTVTPPSPNRSDVVVFSYDAAGNVTSVQNGLGHTSTYSGYNGLGQPARIVGPNGDATDYTYDARDRLVSKTTHPGGVAAVWSYTYDGFGLPASVTAPDNEVTSWHRDSYMRVTEIDRNDKEGTSTDTFTYDAMGNPTSEILSRGSDVGHAATASYDELGRLYQQQGMHGQALTFTYDGNGKVKSVTDAVGHAKNYDYDGLGRIIKTTESGGASPIPISAAPSLVLPSQSTSGSYVVSWAAVPNANSYVLQQQFNDGAWSSVQTSGASSWSASGNASGSYGYRAQACNASGCGPWSPVVSINVLLVPAAAPVIGTSSSGNSGSYSISWTGVVNATSYALQEQINGGAWTAIQNSAAGAISFSNKPVGDYAYRVQACNASGCGPLSAAVNVTVAMPPSSAPTISAPTNSATGSYAVSWTSVTGASTYLLQRQFNGGVWTTLQNTAAGGWSDAGEVSGIYDYRVQACSAGGCGPWSALAQTVVLLPPASAPIIGASSNVNTGAYSISWTGVTAAATYALQEQVNGGAWNSVQNSAAGSINFSGKAVGSYAYQVQACNASGCGPLSSVVTVAVSIPPTSAPVVSSPATNLGGLYSVSWTGVSGATTYTLQQQVNGGAWSTLQSSSAGSWTETNKESTGAYGYRVQACNSSGCGPWSATASTSVTVIVKPPPCIVGGHACIGNQ